MTRCIESGFIECELSSRNFFCLPCSGARAARPREEWEVVRVRIPHDFAVRKYPIAPSLILAVPLQAKHASRLRSRGFAVHRTRAKKKSPTRYAGQSTLLVSGSGCTCRYIKKYIFGCLFNSKF